ncbi:MAG: hypothetical protein AAGK05_14610 [Pseudomonadota bacterium]
MASQLNNDQKILLLLHYERYLTASGKVNCEYTVDQGRTQGVGKGGSCPPLKKLGGARVSFAPPP